MTKNTSEGRVYAGETATERQTRQRQQFMDAGLELIGTVGYSATTIRSLCREAGLTDRYFYSNFENTEALLAAIYGESFRRIEDEFSELLARTPDRASLDDGIVTGLDSYFRVFEDPRVARTLLLEVLGVSDAIDALYRERNLRLARFFEQVTRAKATCINVSDDELGVLCVAAVGAVNQSALVWLLGGYVLPRSVLVAANARLLAAGLASVEHE
jgi:AcrR family transcriptional regulator